MNCTAMKLGVANIFLLLLTLRFEPISSSPSLSTPKSLLLIRQNSLSSWRRRRSTRPKYHRLAHQLFVHSHVRLRYATTLLMSTVLNTEPRGREVFLTVVLPERAFISRFAIEVDHELYVAHVEERKAARKQYEDAVKAGKTAGHVGISARHSNEFRVSVNVEAMAKVKFYLLYEELLVRRLGFYEHLINVTPRQRISSFGIEMRLSESRPIREVLVSNASTLASGSDITMRWASSNDVTLIYSPENVSELQAKLGQSDSALQFVVKYDVDREQVDEVEVLDGYFVHFVAPQFLPLLEKHVVLVLDTSGSMESKMDQTRDAIKVILSDLHKNDVFSFITFSNEANVFKDEMNTSTFDVDDIHLAEKFVDAIVAKGGTNMYDGLMLALDVAMDSKSKSVLLILLSDGQPTEGQTDPEHIIEAVNKKNERNLALFTLAFGYYADIDMLRRLALRNNGFARRIYVAADAAIQLQGFYDEVSNPILRNVSFVYAAPYIRDDSLTATNFHTYFKGSEMVVSGQLSHWAKSVSYAIEGVQALDKRFVLNKSFDTTSSALAMQKTNLFDSEIRLRPNISNFLERFWAYMTIRNLLNLLAQGEIDNCKEKSSAKLDSNSSLDISLSASMDEAVVELCDYRDRALYLSLKYEFVTPLTSLIVVRPDRSQKKAKFNSLDKAMNNHHDLSFSRAHKIMDHFGWEHFSLLLQLTWLLNLLF